MKWLIFLTIPMLVFTCVSNDSDPEEYSVADPDEGFAQSPINIITNSCEEVEHSVLTHYSETHEQIRHLKHTIEVDFDPGSYISFDSVQYDCQQFHFHTPSEHLIDGITYPMEIHFVHTNTTDYSKKDHYFVIGVLFKMGQENQFLKEFIDNVPEDVGDIADYKNRFFNITDFIESEMRDFYHYTGSLTTPPYSETVHWAVSQYILEASPDQIAKINMIEGNNARHIQAVNGRRVELVHN